MNPNVLEYRQAILGAQEGQQPDPWQVRIQWIVDRFGEGATATERQAFVGEKAKATGEAIRRLCKGMGAPRGETLEAISTAFPRVNPAWLLTGLGPRERPATDSADGYAEGLASAAQELREMADRLDRRAGKQPAPKPEAGTDEPTGSPPGEGPPPQIQAGYDRFREQQRSSDETGTDG